MKAWRQARGRWGRAGLVLVLFLSTAACSAPERDLPRDLGARPAANPSAEDYWFWADQSSAEQRERSKRIYQAEVKRRWEAAGRPEEGVKLAFLSISGGGPDGAFSAGLVSGWTASGTRPRFDIVTGISVGALIAPFVFAGPEHDAALRVLFTETSTEEILEYDPLNVLFGALSVARGTPLAESLERFIDEPFLKRVAEVYDSGRSLFIGTTNLDVGRAVFWDMGKIAKAGEADLFRRVMLASASMPGLLPPIEIAKGPESADAFREYHVDGGVTHAVVGLPNGYQEVVEVRGFEFPVEQTFYVLYNSPLETLYEPVEASLEAVAHRSLTLLIHDQSLGDILRIYATAEATGSRFRLVAVPPGFGAASTVDFEPGYMGALFEEGYREGREGIDWLDKPPSFQASQSR